MHPVETFKTKYAYARNGMSDNTNLATVETCGEHTRSTSDTCGRPTGWGRDGHTGPCRDHVRTDETDETDDVTRDDVRDAFETVAAFHGDDVKRYVNKSDAPAPTGQAGRAAVAFTRKVSDRNAWVAAFGTCDAKGCDRGRSGYDTRTCNECDAPDESGDESGDAGNALADLTPEQIEALPESVVREKLN